MKKINLLYHWEALATIAWFMYGFSNRCGINTERVCRVHSMLIRSETMIMTKPIEQQAEELLTVNERKTPVSVLETVDIKIPYPLLRDLLAELKEANDKAYVLKEVEEGLRLIIKTIADELEMDEPRCKYIVLEISQLKEQLTTITAEGNRLREAAQDLYDNRLGWSDGRNPYAHPEFWERLNQVLEGKSQ